MENFATWKRMMTYLLPYKRWTAISAFGIIGGIVLAITIPAVLRDVVDIGLERNNSDYMLAAGLLIVGLGFLRGIMGFFGRFYTERLSHYISYDIRNEVYDKVQHLSFNYHDRSQTGTIITRAISDVDEIQRYFFIGLLDGLNVTILVTGVTIMMFAISPPLAIVALLPLLPLAYLSYKFALSVGPRWKKVMDRVQNLSEQVQENAVGAQVVRAFAREQYEINRFNTENDRWYDDQLDLIKRWTTFLPISAFIVAFSTVSVLLFGGLMETNGIANITVGTVVQFNVYVLIVAQPVRFAGFIILQTTQAVTSAQRVFEILDEPLDIDNKPASVDVENMKGHVVMEDVNFTYKGSPSPVLKNINMEAHPGQVVAVLGSTGSGKTSLINLIPRFHDVTDGRVLIDGIDVRDMDVFSLRRQIGIVLQESLLFSATIYENIAYGRPDASKEEVEAAAKAANAHDFILEFPEGYDTEIGERGVTLSGGQRQRVAIARALLINPTILILDDSTSSVDTQTEFEIQEALSVLMENRTTFIIAQRLTAVKNADQILVLHHGEIVERGTHDELLEQNGRYAEVYRLQLEDQENLQKQLMDIETANQEKMAAGSFSD